MAVCGHDAPKKKVRASGRSRYISWKDDVGGRGSEARSLVLHRWLQQLPVGLDLLQEVQLLICWREKKSLFVGTAASYAEDPVTEDARITRSQETRVAARHRNPSPSPGCSDRTGVLAEA